MRHDTLSQWFVADTASPRQVSQLRLVDAGKGVSLRYGADWMAGGFALTFMMRGSTSDHERLSR